MNKEIQDLVWSVLPKEFKEEVKEVYESGIKMMDIRPSCSEIYANKLSTLEGIFGIDNLTSDAEGEVELLTVPRSKVTELYRKFKKDGSNMCLYAAATLDALFGSKCLPDKLNEDNFAKSESPKYRVNDKVICGVVADRKECMIVHYNINTKEYKLRVIEDGTIIHRSEEFIYGYAPQEPKPVEPKDTLYMDARGFYRKEVGEQGNIVKVRIPNGIIESDLEPYTEPTFTDDCQSPCKSQDSDNIIKDGFREHNRLHIASMIIASIMGSDDWSPFRAGSDKEQWQVMAKTSLAVADTLLSEAEKGGNK